MRLKLMEASFSNLKLCILYVVVTACLFHKGKLSIRGRIFHNAMNNILIVSSQAWLKPQLTKYGPNGH